MCGSFMLSIFLARQHWYESRCTSSVICSGLIPVNSFQQAGSLTWGVAGGVNAMLSPATMASYAAAGGASVACTFWDLGSRLAMAPPIQPSTRGGAIVILITANYKHDVQLLQWPLSLQG